MKDFFDYIFYNLYWFFRWQEDFWNRKGDPCLRKGDLFDSLLVLSFLQGLNITTIIIFTAIITGYSQYMREFHYIYAFAIIGMYISNYQKYQRGGKYKDVIKRMQKRKTSVAIVILYSIVSIFIAILSFLLIPDDVFL